MTKSEIINSVQEKMSAGTTKAVATDALNAVVNTIKEATIADGKLTIAGFGTFSMRERAARKGVNPRRPAEQIDIAASKSIGFKPAKALKDHLNK